MSFRESSAATYPSYPVTGAPGVVVRVDPVARIAYVVGTVTKVTNVQTIGTVDPAARPVSPATGYCTTGGTVQTCHLSTAGALTFDASVTAGGSYAFSFLYLLDV